ncbi:MAG: molybdopterin molybdotransferase MoeA [Flavobacteriales bacterium]|jgi:molybdopterin molybdotransferase|nr:molybdopterin molybdotransferase MoeA [Flavobacteriales bacterium]
MIDVKEAKQRVMANVQMMPAEAVPLTEATGRFAASDVIAPFNHPLFDCSAMDGYAFAFSEEVNEWKVVGEVAAGDAFSRSLKPGECVRIFTGAMVPESADTVVMQELAQRNGNVLTHTDVKLKRGGNVRCKGEQLRTGDVALLKGTLLDASAIGLLASVGVQEVQVAKRPRVALLISGDEFAKGTSPQPGKIFGSNGVMLHAALRNAGIEATIVQVNDDSKALVTAWNQAAQQHDLIISTGGVSVGDHDLIRPTLEAIGAEVILHGVMQKPGKPMLFARLESTPVFGLPGNPRAVMVLFWEYVLPFLRAMQSAAHPRPRTEFLPIEHALKLKGDRAEFRAALAANGKVKLLADEGSHMLRSLVEANVLAYIPAELRELKTGDQVEVHFIR